MGIAEEGMGVGKAGSWGHVGNGNEEPGATCAQGFLNHTRGMMAAVHAILGIRAPAARRARPQGARAQRDGNFGAGVGNAQETGRTGQQRAAPGVATRNPVPN